MIAVFKIVPTMGDTAIARWKLKYCNRTNFFCTPKHINNAVFLEVEMRIAINTTERVRRKKIKYAMERLNAMGVHRMAADPVFEGVAEGCDIAFVKADNAWRAAADKGAICAIANANVAIDTCCVSISAKKSTAEVARAAMSLATRARYVVIQESVGAQKLREMLYQNYGMAQITEPPKGVYTYNLCVDEKPQGMQLVPPKWAKGFKPQCISAEIFVAMLLEMGLISPDEISVESR